MAERVIRTIRNILKKPVFQSGYIDWSSKLPSFRRKYSNNTHHSTEKALIDAVEGSNRKNSVLQYPRQKNKLLPKYISEGLVRVTFKKNVFW